jgi:hypothetical protein
VVFPAPPGPSTLTNKPRPVLKERWFVSVTTPCRLIPKFFERPPACEMDKQPGCHDGVVLSPVRLVFTFKAVSELELLDQ